jgi:hypothetical protein
MSGQGVVYTEYASLQARATIPSLWSYETHARTDGHSSIARNPDGSCRYWLDRSAPLLNTILPGTGVSLIVNFGDPWTAGRSLRVCERLPRVFGGDCTRRTAERVDLEGT